jgi:hypothetical protein
MTEFVLPVLDSRRMFGPISEFDRDGNRVFNLPEFKDACIHAYKDFYKGKLVPEQEKVMACRLDRLYFIINNNEARGLACRDENDGDGVSPSEIARFVYRTGNRVEPKAWRHFRSDDYKRDWSKPYAFDWQAVLWYQDKYPIKSRWRQIDKNTAIVDPQ